MRFDRSGLRLLRKLRFQLETVVQHPNVPDSIHDRCLEHIGWIADTLLAEEPDGKMVAYNLSLYQKDVDVMLKDIDRWWWK